MTQQARAAAVAKERQLDWLLAEALGGGRAAGARPAAPPTRSRWQAAAIALLALGVAVGIAMLRRVAPQHPAQEPDAPDWHECHGPAALASVPADVVALRAFDFDDAACARLARFTGLERLDLGRTDVDEHGNSREPQVTDAGVRSLATLTNLRWLSLARCSAMRGAGLQALEALPRLQHLDLTYCGVQSPAIERLPRLPALHTLVLSHSLHFHGRSLAAVAAIPGLRRLELRGCPTVSAADALHLIQLKQLRHLDLRDCQGRFRGQTSAGFDASGARLQDQAVDTPPVQDDIGITDEVVIALAALPLETLLLGGSQSLTDAIGPALAQMTALRSLDLSNLPKTTGALLANVPANLTALALDDNPQLDGAALRRLPALTGLRELGLRGLPALHDGDVGELLAGKALHTLRLGGTVPSGKADLAAFVPRVTGGVVQFLAQQTALVRLELARAMWLTPRACATLARLPALAELDLSHTDMPLESFAALSSSRSLHTLRLAWARNVERGGLLQLADLRLRELDVYQTGCGDQQVVSFAGRHWPGCRITLANGRVQRAR